MSSPVLFVLLLGTTASVGASWYRADMADRAPVVAGYDWSRHPNGVMFVLPEKGCGCGLPPVQRVRESLKHGLDVLVVAPTSSQDLEALRREKLPAHRFFLHADADSEIVHRFSPGDKIASVRVKNGRITASSTGEVPEEFFH